MIAGRTAKRVAALAAAVLAGGAIAPPGGEVVVAVSGLRSDDGVVSACLVRAAAAFPDCRRFPEERRVTVPAGATVTLRFAGVAPGRYAVALLHDENGNGRADMVLMVPREGFGFSRNAPVRFGPPKFARAAFDVGDIPVAMPIRMRYLL